MEVPFVLHEDIFPWIPQIKRGCCKTSPFCSSPFPISACVSERIVFSACLLFHQGTDGARTAHDFKVYLRNFLTEFRKESGYILGHKNFLSGGR